MKVGDKVIYNGSEFTVIEIDNSTPEVTIHIINENGIGYCVLLTELNK